MFWRCLRPSERVLARSVSSKPPPAPLEAVLTVRNGPQRARTATNRAGTTPTGAVRTGFEREGPTYGTAGPAVRRNSTAVPVSPLCRQGRCCRAPLVIWALMSPRAAAVACRPFCHSCLHAKYITVRNSWTSLDGGSHVELLGYLCLCSC